jgi:DNA-binding protein HU-beta
MSKRQSEEILGGAVGFVTKHLKKGNRIRIAGLGILQVRKRAARMDATPQPVNRSKLRRARKSRSALRRTSRKRSNFPHARHA